MVTTRMAAFVFCDLADSTALQSRLGDEAAGHIRRAVHAALRDAVVVHHGREVKNLGDGLMASFTSAADAVGSGIAMQQEIRRLRPRTGYDLALRVGISAGEATQEEGDWFGTPVVEAARLCARAVPGQVLVSSVAHNLVSAWGRHTFVPVGELELKGLPAPLATYAVAWEDQSAEPVLPPVGLTVEVPLPERLQAPPPLGFLGRGAEREMLTDAWKHAVAGRRRVVLVSGEPGIGKTDLAAEFARAVHDEGIVLYGRCDEELGLPYQPFVEAVRGYLASGPGPGLGEWALAHGDALIPLVPELARRFETAPATGPVDPDTARYRLFQAMGSLLTSISQPQPVLLVVDDLHWAAKPTLLMLKHIVTSADPMALLMVGTFRGSELSASHPLSQLLAQLRREPSVERMSLRGLGSDEVVALVEMAAGRALADEDMALAHALYRETDGNPFFLMEMLRHLSESGAVVRRRGQWEADVALAEISSPDSLREVIGYRVQRLGEEAQGVLSVAAVIGRDFDVDLLAGATGVPEDQLLDLLDQAVAAAIIRDVADRPGYFTFSHALVQHALYEDLGSLRRVRAHHRVAGALEELCAGDPGERVAELARHWVAATRPVKVEKAVEYAMSAGDRALGQLAPEEAVDWYRQALELHTGAAGSEDVRAELLIRLGEAQRRAGEAVFRETLLEAATRARRLGDTDRLVRAVLANNRGLHSDSGVVDYDRVAALEAAVEALGESDSSSRARVLATLAVELAYSGDWRRRHDLADEALAVARRVGDEATLARVLDLRHPTIQVPETIAGRLADTAESLELTARLDDPIERFWAIEFRLRVTAEAGLLDEFDLLLTEDDRLARELGQPALGWYVAFHRASRELLAGRIEESERLALEALQIGSDCGQPDAVAIYAAQLAMVRRDQGRAAELIPLLSQVAAENPGIPGFRILLALCHCDLEQLDDARRIFAVDAANDFADLPYDVVWSSSVAMYAEVCAALGGTGPATILIERLGHASGILVDSGCTSLGAVDRYLGLLAGMLGHVAEAEARFAAAAQLHERIGAPVWLARTLLDWGHLRQGQGRPGDARPLLERARALAGAHGCVLLGEQAARALADQ